MLEDTEVDASVAWPTPDQAWLRVREMQTKLHRWAVADEGFRFDDVYNCVRPGDAGGGVRTGRW